MRHENPFFCGGGNSLLFHYTPEFEKVKDFFALIDILFFFFTALDIFPILCAIFLARLGFSAIISLILVPSLS